MPYLIILLFIFVVASENQVLKKSLQDNGVLIIPTQDFEAAKFLTSTRTNTKEKNSMHLPPHIDKSMESILERYERCSYAERQHNATNESLGSWTLDYAKLKARLDVVQRNQRNYMGEDLDTLNLKELQNLENQLDVSLKHIRSQKNQLMLESISELQKKDKALQVRNNTLFKKIKEREKHKEAAAELEQSNYELDSSPFAPSQQLHSINIGSGNYKQKTTENVNGQMEERASIVNTVMPPWMIRHVNG
ncbi:agamous-like MADS-box protein AGL8 homolog isoform X1 [Impatiens glandulifera]|uniref:agamous-like MADS-box protein AGL8 homolog isoform X1 n=1 Tax=Impatiens glandulifera TaxID=253017 RepID=UPI001FB17BDB|nr:agamous-like MADS-box protein AGL8 homolog isoform X1 [Impatiens glandulifera]